MHTFTVARCKQRCQLNSDQFHVWTLVCGGDRPTVLELHCPHIPRAAGRTAAQRVDLDDQLVARLEGLARPTVANETAWCTTFEIPDLLGAVRALGLQQDEGVWAAKLELGHRTD